METNPLLQLIEVNRMYSNYFLYLCVGRLEREADRRK